VSRTVLLMRHGQGGPEHPSDPELSASGRAEVVSAARQLWLSAARPAFIAHSPLRRAVESARLLASAWDTPPAVEAWPELAPDGVLLELFLRVDARLPAGQTGLLLGHAPVLQAFFGSALFSAPEPRPWRTAELRRLHFPGPVRVGGGETAREPL